MTRAVVDVSVLVSAAITPRNTPPHQVVQAWADRRFDLITSPRLLDELARVLARPKLARYITPATTASFVSALERDAVLAQDPTDVPPATRDPDDDYLVALARAAGAQIIVSSDRDLLEAEVGDIAVLSPRDFLARCS